jgi:hypothetical protein
MDDLYTKSDKALTTLHQNINNKLAQKTNFYDPYIKRDIVNLFHNAAEGARNCDKKWDMDKKDRVLENNFYAAAEYMCVVGGYTPRMIKNFILDDSREEENFLSIINSPQGFRETAVCLTYRTFRVMNNSLTDAQHNTVGKLTSYCPSIKRYLRMADTIEAKKTEYRKKRLALQAA